MTRNNALRGFTLIEVMIVVAILGIVTAIAYPSYQDSVRKSRRADARAVMLEAAQHMERRYTENLVAGYNGVTLPTALQGSPKGDGTKYYNIALSGVAQNTYTLTATPTSYGGQYQDKCGALTLNNAGVKGQGNGKTVDDCWR